jgi:hypothetical protein
MLFYERLGGPPPLAEETPPAQQLPAAADAAADTDMVVSPAVGLQGVADSAAGSPQPMAADGGTPAAAGSAVAGPAQTAGAAADAAPLDAGSSGQRPYNMPASVFQSVMKDNLQVLQEKHTLTKPYFRCASSSVVYCVRSLIYRKRPLCCSFCFCNQPWYIAW